MKWILMLLIQLSVIVVSGQGNGFDFGKVSYEELNMKSYSADTSANAVVLNEFGEAYINTQDEESFGWISFEYHVKIKILKVSALDQANISVRLAKNGSDAERWVTMTASTFNLKGGAIKESKVERGAIFSEKQSAYADLVKFTMPDVTVGSVIEIKYRYDSPFRFNFHRWEFQDNIPKIASEYWTHIPGNYTYNISLKGYLKLSKNESSIQRECYRVDASRSADCSLNKYAMHNVPAFKEEEFVNSRWNYLSSINYELSEYQSFSGAVQKYTKTWEAVTAELLGEDSFGKVLKKAGNIDDDKLKSIVGSESDSLKKANLVYDYVKNWFDWNDDFGIYASGDIKKTYETRKGDIATINLTLTAFLQKYGLDADPVILSTKANGVVTELHPVLSQFNYVITRLTIGNKVYLLDATDSYLPFGTISERCMNGKGRVIDKAGTSWVDLRSADKKRRVISFDIKMDEHGSFKGTAAIQSSGYYAVSRRKEIISSTDRKDYVASLEKSFGNASVEDYKVENLDVLSSPLIEKMQITLHSDQTDVSMVYLNPFSYFLGGSVVNNPFKSNERLYPIDWGTPSERTMVFSVEFPESFLMDEGIANAGLQLPQGGGRFLISSALVGNKVTVTNLIAMNKPVYAATEYTTLKEFYSRILQAQQGTLVFKKK